MRMEERKPMPFPTPNDGKNYSPEEDAFLTREYGKSDTMEIAEALGRRPKGVKSRARKIGLFYRPVPAKIPEGMKYCFQCETSRPLDMFFSHKGSPDGKYSVCKVCSSDAKKAKRLKDKEDKILAKAREEKEELDRAIADKDSKTFVCRICGKEKEGKHFNYNRGNKKVDERCTKCRVDLDIENTAKRIKGGSDW